VGLEAGAREQLAFEGGKKAFAHGVGVRRQLRP
jgi:hypothetical protein